MSSTCRFVPPYLIRRLANLAQNESAIAPQSVWAGGESTLVLDDRMRRRRAQPGAAAPPETVAPRRATVGIPGVGIEVANRVVHDAAGSERLPGRLVRSEGDPLTGDIAVDEAYVSAGEVLALFASAFSRSSYDDRGSGLDITVHFGRNYDNAFWDGSQLVFGDGDQQIFDRFTKPMDVMAHEFTHGVTQFTAGLTYDGQSGALNESISDVFAAMAKQRSLDQQVDQADWLIGVGLFLPGIRARALRSMLEPGTAYDDPRLGRDPQVGSFADYVDTTDDNGGVHVNSGIPNRAFALAARALGGRSWERAGRVWYAALTGPDVSADTGFVDFARACVAAARREFAGNSEVAAAVESAWTEVGVLGADQRATTPRTTPAPATAGGGGAGSDAQRVAVRRTGGVTGTTVERELDLEHEPDGPQVRRLLARVDVTSISVTRSQPDRFVYTVAFWGGVVTIPEHALTPELHEVVQIVMQVGEAPRR